MTDMLHILGIWLLVAIPLGLIVGRWLRGNSDEVEP